MQLDDLIESFLIEAAALTKGSQRVMANKQMVADIADTLRDDARMNPPAFPPGSSRTFQKTSDEDLAQWFLENLDRIEKEGYEGTVYSRDGVNSEWIARRYIAGSHNWEDITGVMNMNLRDWYLLKNRNMLDDKHKDLFKFNSVRDVGYYMSTHYKDKLEKLRDAAKNAARNKMAKSVKLVDNDDYRIYTTLNRAAGCLLGLGTQWCTANSNSGTFFHSYSGKAMLFQMFPYAKTKDAEGNTETVKDEDGKKELADNEKYQFDAGGPNFMDVTDRPAAPDVIKTKYPYLYSDLAKALKANKEKMSQAFEELSNDPTLQHEDFKIKTYEIDDEIEKLGKFVQRGYFTTETRPSVKSSNEAPAGERPEVLPAPAEPEQGQPMAESKAKTLGHIVKTTTFKPAGGNQDSPLSFGGDLEEDDMAPAGGEDMDAGSIEGSQEQDAQQAAATELNAMDDESPEDIIDDIISMQNLGLSKSGKNFHPQELMNLSPDQLKQIHDQVMGAVTETDDDIGSEMDQGMGMPMQGNQQQSNMAPTMPEGTMMEEIDKDVAAMLKSLKKYDMLAESVAPVLMARPKLVAEAEEVEEEEDLEEGAVEDFEASGGKVQKLPYMGGDQKGKSMASSHIGGKAGKKGDQPGKGRHDASSAAHPVVRQGAVKESADEADADVLDWMKRFSKLGKMV